MCIVVGKLASKITAIVTGSSRGIGRAIAIKLASLGFKIAVNYRKRVKEAEKTLDLVKREGADGIIVQADVSKSEDVDKMFERVVRVLGEPLVLVNNAGWGLATPLIQVNENLWNRTIDVNLKSVYLCSKKALPYMLKAGWGRIVNITSIAGLFGIASLTPYSAAKAGVIGFTKALAQELRNTSITVNAIAAGLVRTKMGISLIELSGASIEEWEAKHTITGRIIEPEEVAEIVAFLVSEKAKNVTGQVFIIDSGQSIVEFSRQP